MTTTVGPERTLLETIRVLHRRGAQGITAMPYFYATGHWRCSILVDGDEVSGYSQAGGWRLPGRAETGPTDAEGAADALWAALTDDERMRARQPHPAYAFWWSALLDCCEDSGGLPYFFSDWDNPRAAGYVGVMGDRGFPLPPGVPVS